MLFSVGRRSRRASFAPRLVVALGLFGVPGCLLVQPLDDAKNDGEYDAGENGTGGTGNTGGASSGRGGSTGGKGGGTTGGTGGATGGNAGSGGSTGGGNTGGGAGQGGRGNAGAGAGGSAGSGNTGNVPLVYGPVWTFDEDVEGWHFLYSEPAALGTDSSATHSTAEGEPDAGAVELTIPFDGPAQTVELGVSLPAPLDLTGKTLAARVRLDSGFFGATADPGGAKLFVKTGSGFTYADGAWSSLQPSEWVTVVFDMAAPDFDAGIDPADVRELGVTFKSSAAEDAGWTTATLHVDTVGWVGAERPGCILDPLMIDDMETPDATGWICQKDGRNGAWYVFDDGTTEGASRTPSGSPAMFPLEELDVPHGESTLAVHVSGSGYEAWGGGVGMTTRSGTIDTSVSWDASDYAGISFWARGSGTMWVQASTEEARSADQPYPGLCQNVLALNCNDSFVSDPFELTDAWTEYVIPFSALRQEGWGHPVPWTYNLTAFEFRWGTGVAFDFWIDDLRLIERECEDADPVSCADGGERCRRGTLVETACDTECSERGYMTAGCSSAGCACSDPADPDVEPALDAVCQCAGPELDCSAEGRALLETIAADPQSSVGASFLCYAQYTAAEECETALSSCWGGGA